MSHIDERLRLLEQSFARMEAHSGQVMGQLEKLHDAIVSQGEGTRQTIRDMETRVRHIEQLTGGLDVLTEAARDLRSRVTQLEGRLSETETRLTDHLAAEQVTSRGISWAAAILGGLIASGITGIAGALATRLL